MRILVANNNALFIKELKEQVDFLDDKVCVTAVSDYNSALQAISENPPFNILLLDLSLSGMNWKDGMQKLVDELNGAPVVVLSTPSRYENISSVISGFLSEQNLSSKIIDTSTGKINLTRKKQELDKKIDITPRQTEVLHYLGEGLSNKQVAYEMGVAEATVKLHINALLRKLKVTNRTQAVLKSQKIGLL